MTYKLFHVIQASLGYKEVKREKMHLHEQMTNKKSLTQTFGLLVFLYKSDSL